MNTPMTTIISGKTFEVKRTGNRYFYFSKGAFRWFPVAKSKVNFK